MAFVAHNSNMRNLIWCLVVAVGMAILLSCVTAPNTSAQLNTLQARLEHERWKEWCLASEGVVVEDDLAGRKCYDAEEFRRALQVYERH